MMKKLISALLSLTLLFSTAPFVWEVEVSANVECLDETDEDKIICTATAEDDFAEGRILVVMKKNASFVNGEDIINQLTRSRSSNIQMATDLSAIADPLGVSALSIEDEEVG